MSLIQSINLNRAEWQLVWVPPVHLLFFAQILNRLFCSTQYQKTFEKITFRILEGYPPQRSVSLFESACNNALQLQNGPQNAKWCANCYL